MQQTTSLINFDCCQITSVCSIFTSFSLSTPTNKKSKTMLSSYNKKINASVNWIILTVTAILTFLPFLFNDVMDQVHVAVVQGVQSSIQGAKSSIIAAVDKMTNAIVTMIKTYGDVVAALIEIKLEATIKIKFYVSIITAMIDIFLQTLKEDWTKAMIASKKTKKVDSSDNSSSSNDDETSTSTSTSTNADSKKKKTPPQVQYVPSEVDLQIEAIEKELLIYAPKIREPQKECIGCFSLFQFLYHQPPVAFYAVGQAED